MSKAPQLTFPLHWPQNPSGSFRAAVTVMFPWPQGQSFTTSLHSMALLLSAILVWVCGAHELPRGIKLHFIWIRSYILELRKRISESERRHRLSGLHSDIFSRFKERIFSKCPISNFLSIKDSCRLLLLIPKSSQIWGNWGNNPLCLLNWCKM